MSILNSVTNLVDWSFEDLVRWNQGQILLAIPTGEFNQAVFTAIVVALQWKACQGVKDD